MVLTPLPASLESFPSDIPNKALLGAVLDGRTPGRLLQDRQHDDPVAAGAVIAVGENGSAWVGHGVSQRFLEEGLQEARKVIRLVLASTSEQESLYAWEWAGEREIVERWEHTDPDWEIVADEAARLAPGRTMRRIDRDLFRRCLWHESISNLIGSEDRLLEFGLGVCQMDGETIVTEAYAILSEHDGCEIGGITHEAFRRAGNATVTCARMLVDYLCDESTIYWCCDQENVGSAGTARRLGFRERRSYRCVIIPSL
jgi:RimJ/RimL family protein N-acetyltransferase